MGEPFLLFEKRFPLEVVFRIYDNVLATGIEAILGFSLALLQKNEEPLLGLKFDDILDFLRNKLFDAYKVSASALNPNLSILTAGLLFRTRPKETIPHIGSTNSCERRVWSRSRLLCWIHMQMNIKILCVSVRHTLRRWIPCGISTGTSPHKCQWYSLL